MGVPFYVICHFSLVAFNVLSLSLIFVSLIPVCLDVFPPWVYPVWYSLCFLDLVDYFPSHIGNVSAIISSNIFSGPFSLSSPSGTLIMHMLVCLMLSQRYLRLSSFF